MDDPNAILVDETPETVEFDDNGLYDDENNDEIENQTHAFDLPLQLPGQQPVREVRHVIQLSAAENPIHFPPPQNDIARMPSQRQSSQRQQSSQKHISQNNSSINKMQLPPRTIDESPVCPNGNCAVNRQITPQFQQFQQARDMPPPPPLPVNNESPIRLSDKPALPQQDKQSEPQLPQVSPPAAPTNNGDTLPPPPPLPVPAQQQVDAHVNKNKFPPLPVTATQQHHPASPTQFQAQTNLFQKPVNQPGGQPVNQPAGQPVNQPAGQQQQGAGQQGAQPTKAMLPTFNNTNCNTCNNGCPNIIRPPQNRTSKTLIPSLFWDGQVPITNMRSLTEKNNKNILTHVEPIPYNLIEQIFTYGNSCSDRTCKRFVIGESEITLTYILPNERNARKAWENQLKVDTNFKKFIDDYNEEIKQKLSEIYNIPLDKINQIIANLLTEYMNANTDRLSKPSGRSSAPSFTCVNGVCSINQQCTQQPCNGMTPQPQRCYKTCKECMDTAEPICGYRRVMRSQNPCVVEYIEIKNKKDLQNSMIGSTVNNPIMNDADCAVKYNMIKTFLDESGYHLVKNTTPRKSRKSRKN